MVPDELSGGPHFAAFCERYIRHTKGRWGRGAGQALALEPWQREFWWEALELDPATGLRIYSEVGLGLPRKNGKSTIASASALYGLVADGENEPEVYVGAGAKQQAGIVMGQSLSMARRSARLAPYVRVQKYVIEGTRNGGVMRALASEGALQHGLNPSWTIIDELHAHRDDSLYTALTTGTLAREQPFTFWITTAGADEEGLLAQLYGQMFEGTGELEDRGSLLVYRDRPAGVLVYWYGAPKTADIEDPAVWKACNPASWLQQGKELAREHAKLRGIGALTEWRTYHLNQFVSASESWLPDGAWAACVDDLPLNPELPVGVGIVKAQHSDHAAVVVAQRQGDRVVVRWKPFSPEAITGRVSSEAMREHLRELRARYPVAMVRDQKTRRLLPGPAFAYDRVQFAENAEILEQEGLDMVETNQTAATMAPPSTLTYELVTSGRLRHDGDRTLAEHMDNAVAVLTERGMKVQLPKVQTQRRSHGAVALVMAIAMAMQDAPKSTFKPRAAGGF